MFCPVSPRVGTGGGRIAGRAALQARQAPRHLIQRAGLFFGLSLSCSRKKCRSMHRVMWRCQPCQLRPSWKQVSIAQRAPVRRAGCTRRVQAEKHLDRLHPWMAAQHEPDVGPRQAAAGGDHPPDGEVGVRGAAVSPGTRCRVQASAGSGTAIVRASREAGAPGASRGRVRDTMVSGRSSQSRVSTGTSVL